MGVRSPRCGAKLLSCRAVVPVTEGATGRTLHDGLLALEGDVRVVALAERAVAVAGEQMANLAQPHFLVGLGILAARDVEVENCVAGFQHLHLQRAVRRLVLIELDEVGHGCPAASLLRKILAFGNGSLADGSV